MPDLNLKTVIETQLDGKGFDDLKDRAENAANSVDRAGKKATGSSEHFEKLGKKLPNTAFDLLSREMLRNAGVQEGLGPLTRVSTTALESLAAAGKLTGSALAGATLGLSLLIPLLAALASQSDDASDSTTDVKESTDTLVESYQKLIDKGVPLTKSQREYLGVLKEVQVEERKRAEDSIQKQIDAQEKLIKSTDSLWGATKLLAKGMIDFYIRGKEYVSVEDLMFQKTEKARQEQQRLGGQLEQLKKAHDAGFSSIAAYNAKLEEEAKKSKDAADKTAEHAKKVAEFRAALEGRIAQESASLAVESAETVAAKEEAIAKQEAVVLAEQIKAAQKAEATLHQLDELRALSHARVLQRIRVEEKRWATDQEKMISDGLKKNKEEAREVIANLEMERQAKKEAQAEKEALAAQDIQIAQAGIATVGTIFGKNKAVAVAQALVDTYAAANAALKNPPGPPVSLAYVALAVATGLKNIQSIENAQPAGFDDPQNDAILAGAFRNFGRKWAADAANIATNSAARGFGEGAGQFGQSQAPGSVIHQNTKIDRGTHIGSMTFNGSYFTPRQAMLEMERRRIKIERVENRTRRRNTT
jgi:hypothetical protein